MLEIAANQTVLALLAERRLLRRPPKRVEPGTDMHPMDEGGSLFVHRYGHLVPDRAKLTMDLVTAFVHDRSGEIFAVHWGRLTIVVRYRGWPLRCDAWR